jgi:hypothetical protein
MEKAMNTTNDYRELPLAPLRANAMQGYFFGKPLMKDEVAALLENNARARLDPSAGTAVDRLTVQSKH